jgi:hypothetical protein
LQRFQFVKNYPAPIRLGLFVIALLAIWLPLAIPLFVLLPSQQDNLASIITLSLLYLEFIALLRFWHNRVYGQLSFLPDYGLARTPQNGFDFLLGASIGLSLPFLLFTTETFLGWLQFQSPSLSLLTLVLEGLLVGLAVGFAEELLFRGWLLNELKRDYRFAVATGVNALIFASLHFIKPWQEIIRTFPQFPGLILLGIVLVWAREARQGRLGLAIGLHGGLVWGYYIIDVGDLFIPTAVVPPWLTGVDGNPLAGLMGLLFLSGLAWAVRRYGRANNSSNGSS